MIFRNLTSTFIRARYNRRGGRDAAGAGGALIGAEGSLSESRPLRSDDPKTAGDCIEMAPLPPQWANAAHEAREDIKTIKGKLKELAKAQSKRLKRVFGDDQMPDKEVEASASQISSLLRRCEQTIHSIKTRGGQGVTESDRDLRLNVQRGLSTQLQQCLQEFRGAQKEYMLKIRDRQKGSSWDDPAPSSGAKAGQAGGDGGLGFDTDQMFELESLETNASSRSVEILSIASSIGDLHTIFKELAVLVIDQGSILDRIDYNIEQVVDQSREANTQLQKAERSQKSNRAMKCIVLLLIFNVVMLLILILRMRH